MDVQVTEEQGWVRNLVIDVPYDELKPEFEKALKQARKDIKMEGFRKGKVPLTMVKKLYGARIELDTLEDKLPEILEKAFREKELKVVARPKLNNIDFHPGSDLKLEVSVEVEPEFELKKYENFKFDYEVYEVTEDDINAALEDVRAQHASWKTLEDEPATESDFVVLDMQKLDESGMPLVGEKKSEEFFPLSKEGELTELGRQLVGVKKGDVRKVVIMPEAEPGSDAPVVPEHYEVTVKEVYRQTLPEIDDDLAKDTGEFETLDELKKDLERRIKRSAQENFDDMLHEQMIEKLIESNPFDLPEGMIEQRLDEIVEEVKESAKDYDQEIDEGQVREQYRDIAIKQVKWRLIREKLIDLLEIKVEEEDVRKEFDILAAGSNVPDLDAAWESFRRDLSRFSSLYGRVLSKRIFEELKSRQKIKEKKITIKDIRKANEKQAKQKKA